LPLRSERFPGVLLHELVWFKGLNLAFEYVARSPKDQPVVITAVAQWGSGRTRVALGGFGSAPIIAMDGTDESGVDIASRDAFAEAEDQWATAHYRRDVAAKLTLRCVARINAMKRSEV
jgi:CO/xanthine dehydrogenase FAD-binding subunit